MFLNTVDNLNYLTEAPEDDTSSDGGMTGGNEPTESDADMDLGGGDDGMGDDMSGGDSGMDDGMGDDMSGGDTSGGGDSGMDDGMGDDQQDPIEVEETIKKKRLYSEYKDLLYAVDELLDATSNLDVTDYTDNENKILQFINKKMEDNQKKMRFIMTERFPALSYKELLTIFMYCKIQTKDYTEILDRIVLQKKVISDND